jgi:hypothetical protein
MAGGTQGGGIKRWGGPGGRPNAGRSASAGSVPSAGRSSSAGEVPSAVRYGIPFPADGLPMQGVVDGTPGGTDELIADEATGELIVNA